MFNTAIGNRAALARYRSRDFAVFFVLLYCGPGNVLRSDLLQAATLSAFTLFIYRPLCYLSILFTQVLVAINTSQISLATRSMELLIQTRRAAGEHSSK
jgi:hypothetical protein